MSQRAVKPKSTNQPIVSNTEIYNLYFEEASVIPLYEGGSLGSVVLDFGSNNIFT